MSSYYVIRSQGVFDGKVFNMFGLSHFSKKEMHIYIIECFFAKWHCMYDALFKLVSCGSSSYFTKEIVLQNCLNCNLGFYKNYLS